MSDSTVLHTERLRIRPLEERDAPFILALLNEPDFLRFIGDRAVHTEEAAVGYIVRARESQARLRFGLNVVELVSEGMQLGIAGLMQKPWLDAPDLAYALRREAAGQGYATEAAAAVLEDGTRRCGMTRVLAVVTPENAGSIRVLDKLGFRSAGTVCEPQTGEALLLYARAARPS